MTLAASVLLERLRDFRSTQLATYGLSAIPLVAACVAAGGGRYSGAVIRREPKAYGAGRRIDGALERGRPVVVVDESISSGTSVYEAARALEAEGYEVEGALCLVEFSGYGAVAWLSARGYRIETVYDVWRDLGPRDDRPASSREEPWGSERVPDGLSPPEAARAVVDSLLRTGRLLQPPRSFDRAYDARGGTFVSIRRRDDDRRLARAGVRRGDGEKVDPTRDLVLAAAEAARLAPAGTLGDLSAVKVAVSFLGPLAPITAGAIDHDRHALVVRGLGPLDRLGFALPNAPHYDDELEQYRYARTVTGRFWQLEPHALFRQGVERVVESGETWPPYGAPEAVSREGDDALAAAIARRVDELLRERPGLAAEAGRTTPRAAERALPAPAEPHAALGVSLYAGGLAGCALSLAADLDEALGEATTAALADRRYGDRASRLTEEQPAVVVSLLRRRRPLGAVDRARLPLYFRLGRDTLWASAPGRTGVVLAHFAAQQGVTADRYVAQVLEKAGIADDVATWTAFETAAWLVKDGRARPLEHGFPTRPRFRAESREACVGLAEEISRHVFAQRCADGVPAYAFHPWTGRSTEAGTATRVLLALAGLLEVSPYVDDVVRAGAEELLDRFLEGGEPASPRADLVWDAGSDAQLLACLGRLDRAPPAVDALVGRLLPLVREDGAIYAGAAGRMASDLDLLSGLVLLALARAARWSVPAAEIDLERVLVFYRRRFALARPWTMVWWHGQAWAALADRVPGARALAFELVDWALERQSAKSGAFLVDGLEPHRLSFLSACVLEAVADAWALASESGDAERAARYERSWRRGVGFVERLVVRGDDVFFSPDPERALGGVRPTVVSSELRIDYAGHALLALGKGLRASA